MSPRVSYRSGGKVTETRGALVGPVFRPFRFAAAIATAPQVLMHHLTPRRCINKPLSEILAVEIWATSIRSCSQIGLVKLGPLARSVVHSRRSARVVCNIPPALAAVYRTGEHKANTRRTERLYSHLPGGVNSPDRASRFAGKASVVRLRALRLLLIGI